jgi:hypothetical protein
MATTRGPTPTPDTQESLFYERCWRCRAVVPNGLVRRRVMQTGYTRNATSDIQDHYDTVSLCGVCDDELTNAERLQVDVSYRRWSWFWRIVGVAFWTVFLTRVGIPFPVSLAIMLTLAYFLILGRAIITIFVTTIAAGILGYPPPHYAEPIMLSWAIIWPGLILWQLWHPENRPWPFRKIRHAASSHSVHQEASLPTAVLSKGGETR